MLCKIADLLIDIPATGGMTSRCREYQEHVNNYSSADITIYAEEYSNERWGKFPLHIAAYLNSGIQFYRGLIHFNGMMLHASAVELDGRAYLFSAPCGTGKSTHTRLWQKAFGERAHVFNDDKPALRRIDGVWYAYGTPWCGKDGININMKAPVAGICFLRRGEENSIKRIYGVNAVSSVISQTMRKFKDPKNTDLMLSHVDTLINEIPIYELHCKPDTDAAILSYKTMREGSIQ